MTDIKILLQFFDQFLVLFFVLLRFFSLPGSRQQKARTNSGPDRFRVNPVSSPRINYAEKQDLYAFVYMTEPRLDAPCFMSLLKKNHKNYPYLF